MPRSRAQNQDNGEDGSSHLPPPPSAADILAQLLGGQSKMEAALNRIAQNTASGSRAIQEHGHNHHSSFKDFLDTKPPIFTQADEPLQADEWLNTIEQTFRLLDLSSELKAEFAGHRLQGPAGIWWTNYLKTLLPGSRVTWEQFKEVFRGYFIPAALMGLKRKEFQNLVQGTKTVTEFLHVFNHLSQYAPELVDTPEKKI